MNYDTVEGKGLLPFDKVEKIILPFGDCVVIRKDVIPNVCEES
jgi:hypothetical protein